MKIFIFWGLFIGINSFAQNKKIESTAPSTPQAVEATNAPSTDLPDSSKTPQAQPHKVEQTKEAPAPYLVHGIGLGIGQTMLFGGFSDHADDSLAFDVFYQYRASYSFDFLANFHTNTYKKDDGQKTDLTGVTFNIKGRLYDYDSFAPYFTGGLGFYWPKVTRYVGGNLLESETKMVLGFNGGFGVDLQINEHFSFGFAGIYHHPLNAKQDNQESVNGSYLRLMAIGTMFF